MDPFSAILLIGIMTVAGVKTAGSAVTDGIAQARGQTPPSLEKWRANQEKRRKRGEQPRADPGWIKRIFNNQMEAAAKRSAYKHQGTMQYLDDHGEEIADGKRRRLETTARCRQVAGGKLAAAGGSSWNALRTAAALARRGHPNPDALDELEDEAWAENRRRDAERSEPDHDQDPGDGSDDNVVPFNERLAFLYREDGNLMVRTRNADDPDDGTSIRGDARDPATWRGTDRYGRDIQTGRGPSYTDGHGIVHDSDEYLLGDDLSPERRIVTEHRAGRQLRLSDPPPPQPDPEREHEVEQAAADREHTEHPAQLHQHTIPEQQNPETSTDNSSGGPTVSTPSGEITDLPSALNYVRSASDYCEQIGGTFELTQAQANATGQEIEGQLGGLELAQSALRGFELHSEADRLSQVHEKFTELVEAMQQLEQASTAAREALSSAQSTLDASATEFESQTGISEQLNSHDSVANDTKFYTNA